LHARNVVTKTCERADRNDAMLPVGDTSGVPEYNAALDRLHEGIKNLDALQALRDRQKAVKDALMLEDSLAATNALTKNHGFALLRFMRTGVKEGAHAGTCSCFVRDCARA